MGASRQGRPVLKNTAPRTSWPTAPRVRLPQSGGTSGGVLVAAVRWDGVSMPVQWRSGAAMRVRSGTRCTTNGNVWLGPGLRSRLAGGQMAAVQWMKGCRPCVCHKVKRTLSGGVRHVRRYSRRRLLQRWPAEGSIPTPPGASAARGGHYNATQPAAVSQRLLIRHLPSVKRHGVPTRGACA